jgi:NMD protein affecting ribosome stability and mRNA decay
MRRTRAKTHEASSVGRLDRNLKEHESDAYGLRGKLPDPTVCPRCGAIYRAGRWTWGAAPADAHRTECPACRRVADRVPAGIVTVQGDFAAAHREEIRNLARNVEEREKAEHALKRIIELREGEDGDLVISTTDAKLARSIADALDRAYKGGRVDYRFVERESCFRATWSR